MTRDPHYSPFATPSKPPEPGPELLERCWQLTSTHTGKVLSCGIYRIAAPGLEVRCGFSEDDVLRTQLAPNLDGARAHAADWKRLVLAKGGFSEARAEPDAR